MLFHTRSSESTTLLPTGDQLSKCRYMQDEDISCSMHVWEDGFSRRLKLTRNGHSINFVSYMHTYMFAYIRCMRICAHACITCFTCVTSRHITMHYVAPHYSACMYACSACTHTSLHAFHARMQISYCIAWLGISHFYATLPRNILSHVI